MIHLDILFAAMVSVSTSVVEGDKSCIFRDVLGSYEVPERGNHVFPVHLFTLTNGNNVEVKVMEYGATITSVKAPDSKGKVEEISLGYDTLEGYFGADNPYFGATVGRVANRVRNAQFSLDGVTYSLFPNIGKHSLHGGQRAFDKKLWSGKMEGDKVVMEYTSSDGEEGYPGQVTVTVTYSLTSDNTLVIEYRASATKRTPINLTNHVYFNLAGHGAGANALYNHIVTIKADHITETDTDFIPTGKLLPVEGTNFDLRKPINLGTAIKNTAIDGFDNNFVISLSEPESPVAVVEEPASGRRLELQTTQPGVQFFTSNFDNNIHGRAEYSRHAAFCLEAQNFPDAINHPKEFPNSVYGPGDIYHQVIKYRFGVSSTKDK